ncbi:EP1-like glycoprotein 1 [Papaver somniferum]|uniref:EP1-like glycoprotein 1 n=1 Tax=Papaver somniferum TaxID=3469 RepID=UPI000E6F6034|nr:EP1-like glycoprotein 1 [Papaver somniferum]
MGRILTRGKDLLCIEYNEKNPDDGDDDDETPIHRIRRPKYNSTLSLVQLGSDGNLHVHTYYDKGYWNDAWDETFTYFASDQCRLPEKCGSFGICSKNQCVACPTPNGLSIWSEDCKPPTLPSCKTSTVNASYYQIEGVDHFLSMSNEGEGPMKIDDCKKKCSMDCKCAAVFYRKDTSKCLLTNQLNTLTKFIGSSDKDHIAFVKYANNVLARDM